MEVFLINLIEENIPELRDEIYPTNAPEVSSKPYLVYMRIGTKNIKTLDGFTKNQSVNYLLNIMDNEYLNMIFIRNKLEYLIKSIIGRREKNLYIEDVNINKIEEVYEFNLKVNRGIIDFTIYFNKEDNYG